MATALILLDRKQKARPACEHCVNGLTETPKNFVLSCQDLDRLPTRIEAKFEFLEHRATPRCCSLPEKSEK